ncbi:MAG: GntR family transcriptional regulator [Gemmatimonadota bacterium]
MNGPQRADGRLVASAAEDDSNSTYFRLRDLIVDGSLAPGARIVESRLAERLEVSRRSLRLALQRLEQEGFLERDDRTGRRSRPVVSPLTRSDGRELFDLLGALEGLAARRAARLPGSHRHKLVDTLQSLNRALQPESDEGRPSPDTCLDLDAEFHRTLVEASAGPRLRRLHRAFHPQAERYGRFYLSPRTEAVDRPGGEHEPILDTIRVGDAEAAEAAAERCWRRTGRRMGQRIAQAGERGGW